MFIDSSIFTWPRYRETITLRKPRPVRNWSHCGLPEAKIMAQPKEVNLQSLFAELSNYGQNQEYDRALKVANKSKRPCYMFLPIVKLGSYCRNNVTSFTLSVSVCCACACDVSRPALHYACTVATYNIYVYTWHFYTDVHVMYDVDVLPHAVYVSAECVDLTK
jgi:hypothetical protein